MSMSDNVTDISTRTFWFCLFNFEFN